MKKIVSITTSLFLTMFCFSQTMEEAKVLNWLTIGQNKVYYLQGELSNNIYKTEAVSENLGVGEKVKVIQNPLGKTYNVHNGLSYQPFIAELIAANEYDLGRIKDLSTGKANLVYSRFEYCNVTENPIGGGKGYSELLDVTSADIVINANNADPLYFSDVVKNAQPGQTIFIENNVVMDLTGIPTIFVPNGVTIASGRNGLDEGALLYTYDMALFQKNEDRHYPMFRVIGSGSRITGIRLRGPSRQKGCNQKDNKGNTQILNKVGILIAHCEPRHYTGICAQNQAPQTDVVIDNCEIFDFPGASIQVGVAKPHHTPSNEKFNIFDGIIIRNNHIHHNLQRGLGYGVLVNDAFVKVYANLFEFNRHDIADSGWPRSGYEASCNVIRSGGLSHNFDVHNYREVGDNESIGVTSMAGKHYFIHHNEFLDDGSGRDRIEDNNDCISGAGSLTYIYFRGRPRTYARIENNYFYKSGHIASIKQRDVTGKGEVGNLIIVNNLFRDETEDFLENYQGYYVRYNYERMFPNNFIFLRSDYSAQHMGWQKLNDADKSNYNFIFRYGDVDGDGLTDVIKLENGKIYYLPLQKPQFFDQGGAIDLTGYYDTWRYLNYTGIHQNKLVFGHFDSDNKTDMIMQDGPQINLSSGLNSQWKAINYTNYNLYDDMIIGDYDGNGVMDLLISENGSLKVSFDCKSQWSDMRKESFLVSSFLSGKFSVLNNKYDLFKTNGTIWELSYDAKYSFTPWNYSSYVRENLFSMDVDGDGYSDITPVKESIYSKFGSSQWQKLNTTELSIYTFGYGDLR